LPVAAKERGVGNFLSTDAQSTEELRLMEFAVYQVRRAGLEAKAVANTYPLTRLRELFKR
jgi:histidinol phosphatase-like PHP family hydrolase